LTLWVRLTETGLARVLLVLSYDIRPESCAPSRNVFSHARLFTATATVMARRPAGSTLPLTCHELSLNWMSSLTRSPILGPITRNHARRPVARDLNGRSLMRQLSRVFRRPFPTFLDPSHGFLPLSGLHCPARNSISGSWPLENSSSRQLNCKFRAINTIRLGGGGRRRRYNLCAEVIQQAALASFSMVVLFFPLFASLRTRRRTRTVLVATITNIITLTSI